MGKIVQQLSMNPKSPKQVHQQIMKSTLGIAIELKKIDNQISKSQNQGSSFFLSSSKASASKLKLDKQMENGFATPASALNKSLNRNEVYFNNKEIKNITFLPFLRERNGLGRIIESDQEIPLKVRKVPSILQTNRILAQKKKNNEEATINLNENVSKNFASADSILSQSNALAQSSYGKKKETDEYSTLLTQRPSHTKQISLTSILSPNNNAINNSKFLDDQQSFGDYLSKVRKHEEGTHERYHSVQVKEISNQNHLIMFQNFKIQKDKNFVLLNSLTSQQFTGKPQKQDNQKKIKLRNNQNIICQNLPALGTYDPKLELIEPKLSSAFTFENSNLLEQKRSLKKSASMITLIKKPILDKAQLNDDYTKMVRLLDPNRINEADNTQSSENNTQRINSNVPIKNVFETKLPEIPLDNIYEQRSKIKSMILDIKANIYKMDKY